jgi:hypothetical protein
MSNKLTTKVTIKITNQDGHSTLEQDIDDAIKTAFELKLTKGQNLNIRGEAGLVPFELFAGVDDAEGLLQDAIRLHKLLEQYENPVIYVTGTLAGGVR